MEKVSLASNQKVYFASDFHLGIPTKEASLKREKLVCKWLREVSLDAKKIYLVGDIFDVWFEYKEVIPKGFSRLFGTLAELKDKGIEIEIFTGNHDFWMNNYFQSEFEISVHTQNLKVQLGNKIFEIAHGDGLGPADNGYKLLKKVLANPFCQWLYKGLHPNFGIGLASWFSRRGPKHKEVIIEKYQGKEKEWLVSYGKDRLKEETIDYFVFGHRHLPIEFTYSNGSQYFNLGDWLSYFTYLTFDGEKCNLKSYTDQDEKIIKDKE